MEIWKDVEGLEGLYQISNLGRVKSLSKLVNCKNGSKRKTNERVLKPTITKLGYSRIQFGKKGKHKFIHRLVAEAFIPNPGNLPQVNHKNHDKSDNRVENLMWGNASKNKIHDFDTGNFKKKLSKEEVLEIRNLIKEGENTQKIANLYNLSRRSVQQIKSGETWSWLP